MKNLFFASLAVVFTLNPVSAQVVAEVQQSLITKRTATWCPYCGTWGWDFFEDLQANTSGKAVLIAAHFGGSSLENPASIEFVANLGSSSQPKFFVNNELQTVTSSNTADALQVIKTKVNNNYLVAPLANVGLETAWDGAGLIIKTKTKFFQASSGEYYLGLYLVEDEVQAQQQGQSGQVDHMRVLRAAATATTFGNLLANGAISAGTEFDGAFPVSISGYDIDNLDIVGVIWKKDAGKYLVVNVWAIDAKPGVSGSTETPDAGNITAKLFPNIIRDENPVISLVLESKTTLSILLADSKGSQIQPLFSGTLPEGRHEWEVDADFFPSSGWYSVLVRTEQGEKVALPLLRMSN